MTTSECRAAVPEICRYHSLGKELPQEKFDEVLAHLESVKRTQLVLGKDLTVATQIQRHYSTYAWTQAIKSHKRDLRQQAIISNQLPLNEQPETVVDEIYNNAVTVYNNSADQTFDSYRGQVLPFKQIIDARTAKNNCGKFSTMLVRDFTAEDFGSEKPLEVTRMDAVDSKKKGMFWHHAAIIVHKEGKPYVVDYTIRQFNPKLPVPYIAIPEQWAKDLNEATGEKWTTETLSPWADVPTLR